MTYTIEMEVPTVAAGETAYKQLPAVTKTVFAQLEALAPNWNNFRYTLQGELDTREWQDAVTLMTSLGTPQASVALARRRHDILAARGDLTFGIVGGPNIGKRFMPIREERLLSDAQVVIGMLQQHLALNYRVGDIRTNGTEHHLKVGTHAPFVEFERPENFLGAFSRGSSLLKRGADKRILLPSLTYGSAVILTRQHARQSAVLFTTKFLSEDQLLFAKKAQLFGKTDAHIIHGVHALPVQDLRQQLESGICGKGGQLRETSLQAQTFDLAIDIDKNDFVADFQGTPQWFASTIS